MNVFDFDKTILRGDTTALFTWWCVRRYPSVRLHVLRALRHAIAMKRGKISLQDWKQELFGYFALIPDMNAAVEDFWDSHIARIYPWYLSIYHSDDVVISASPQFLVADACARIGIRHVLGSPVDPRTGRFTGLNCSKEEKVRRYREEFGDVPIDHFYSDSHSDDPLAAIAKEPFLVKKGHPRPWK